MPVRIRIGDLSSDPRVISLEAYENGRINFDMHYYYTTAEGAFGGQVVEIPWNDLQTAVDDFITNAAVPENEVALRFVHCFDTTTELLYQRLQICQMVPSETPPPPGAILVYDLITTNAVWYEIKEGIMEVSTTQTLFSPQYLNSFYYKTEPQAAVMEKLADGPGKYVKNLVLPWAQEVKLMYQENGSPENAGVHFAACSYTESSEYSNVLWPHGLVIYLSDSTGEAMLDNDTYISIFHNKGADFTTMCPPNCNVYIAPDVI